MWHNINIVMLMLWTNIHKRYFFKILFLHLQFILMWQMWYTPYKLTEKYWTFIYINSSFYWWYSTCRGHFLLGHHVCFFVLWSLSSLVVIVIVIFLIIIKITIIIKIFIIVVIIIIIINSPQSSTDQPTDVVVVVVVVYTLLYGDVVITLCGWLVLCFQVILLLSLFMFSLHTQTTYVPSLCLSVCL